MTDFDIISLRRTINNIRTELDESIDKRGRLATELTAEDAEIVKARIKIDALEKAIDRLSLND